MTLRTISSLFTSSFDLSGVAPRAKTDVQCSMFDVSSRRGANCIRRGERGITRKIAAEMHKPRSLLLLPDLSLHRRRKHEEP